MISSGMKTKKPETTTVAFSMRIDVLQGVKKLAAQENRSVSRMAEILLSEALAVRVDQMLEPVERFRKK